MKRIQKSERVQGGVDENEHGCIPRVFPCSSGVYSCNILYADLPITGIGHFENPMGKQLSDAQQVAPRNFSIGFDAGHNCLQRNAPVSSHPAGLYKKRRRAQLKVSNR